MKMSVVFLLLLKVSQHALAVVVEVNKEEKSVLLPCQYSGFVPEDLTVMWTRSDLDLKFVHRQQEGIDDLKGQNQRYSGRTSLRPDAVDTGDFSLTLRTPQLTDSGNYTCSISAERLERRLGDIQLQVKDHQMEVKVEEGSESVILPCKTKSDLPEDVRVEWTHSDRELMMVHVYPNRGDQLNTQDGLYRDRTEMNGDLLRTGDLSLTLKHPTERDTGGYICTIYRDKDILRQKVVLHVREPFPSWAIALLVLLVLLVVSGGLLFHFRQYFMSGSKVEVDSGVESVRLPCKTIVRLPKDTKLEWTDRDSRKVHVYQSSSDEPEEQHEFYRGRTTMERNLRKPGDLSLTLKHPTNGDNSTYTCTIYNKRGGILMEKQVELRVRVPQVEVGSEVVSVQLPFRTTLHLPEDAKVEWKEDNYNKKVHVYHSGSDQPEERDQVYRDQTIMNEDLLKTGDLSLTLKYPTDEDNRTYTCTVYSREGHILLRKQVELKVRVYQVEVEEGVESVQLPFQTTQNLPEDAQVWWWDSASRRVHLYQNGSDRPEQQHQVYGNRTKMNEDPLRTGDLSLTLRLPTERDSGRYRSFLYSRNICKWKNVQIKVKGRAQVQDQTGIIKNRSNSIDPTPLIADQSV